MKKKTNITIDDIARDLGVSKTTVSRAISGKGRISNATRERIQEYIQRTNYRPSAAAKGLAESKTYYELLPAVNNLIFVHSKLDIIKDVKKEILNLQYLVNKVNGQSLPIIVRDSEMQQFIRVVENYEEEVNYFCPEEINISKGTRVRIIGGSFDGVEGVFMKVKGKRSKRVVVMLDKLLAVVMAEVESDLIEVIKN